PTPERPSFGALPSGTARVGLVWAAAQPMARARPRSGRWHSAVTENFIVAVVSPTSAASVPTPSRAGTAQNGKPLAADSLGETQLCAEPVWPFAVMTFIP